MDKLLIRGNGTLKGRIPVSGSKNSCLPILAASILTRGELIVNNAPHLRDVQVMLDLLRALGVSAERRADGAVMAKTLDESEVVAPYEIVNQMRGSVCVLGPLLARRHKAKVSLPGGCVIGVRPIDLHLKGLAALGAKITVEHGYVVAEAPQGLRGAEIYLGSAFGSSVLGTANIMMAATLAKGKTVIENAACEPEVEDLAYWLKKMGAKIKGAGSHRIEIEGVKDLGGVEGVVIPDRIEAGTFILAGVMTRGEVTVEHCRPDHLSALFDKLREAGAEFECSQDSVHVRASKKTLQAVDMTTLPYPGFPTDLQAQWMALMTMCQGVSVVTERIYPDRFIHAAELLRMGANIRREGPHAIIQGPAKLSGAPVMASDLRASAALVLAGLVADGETEVNRVYHIDRGYEQIEKKLNGLGAKVQRISESYSESSRKTL